MSDYQQIPQHYRDTMETKYGSLYGFPDPTDSKSVQAMQSWVNSYWLYGLDANLVKSPDSLTATKSESL